MWANWATTIWKGRFLLTMRLWIWKKVTCIHTNAEVFNSVIKLWSLQLFLFYYFKQPELVVVVTYDWKTPSKQKKKIVKQLKHPPMVQFAMLKTCLEQNQQSEKSSMEVSTWDNSKDSKIEL